MRYLLRNYFLFAFKVVAMIVRVTFSGVVMQPFAMTLEPF